MFMPREEFKLKEGDLVRITRNKRALNAMSSFEFKSLNLEQLLTTPATLKKIAGDQKLIKFCVIEFIKPIKGNPDGSSLKIGPELLKKATKPKNSKK